MSLNDASTADLSAELADLRKRRDLKELSASEIELLASKPASMMIEAAHSREATADAKATGLIADASRQVQAMIAEAEAEARKLIATAQAEASRIAASVESETAGLRKELQAKLGNVEGEKERLLEAARREAREITSDADAKVAQYRAWLRRQVDDARKIQKGLSDRLSAISETSRSHDEALGRSISALDDLHGSSDPSTQI